MSQLKIWDESNNTWVGIPAGGVGVPSGGNAGDVLVKSSSTDYATEWQAPSEKLYDFDATLAATITNGGTETVTLPNPLSSYKWLFMEALRPSGGIAASAMIRVASLDTGSSGDNQINAYNGSRVYMQLDQFTTNGFRLQYTVGTTGYGTQARLWIL